MRTILNYPILSVSNPEKGIRTVFRDLAPAVRPAGT